MSRRVDSRSPGTHQGQGSETPLVNLQRGAFAYRTYDLVVGGATHRTEPIDVLLADGLNAKMLARHIAGVLAVADALSAELARIDEIGARFWDLARRTWRSHRQIRTALAGRRGAVGCHVYAGRTFLERQKTGRGAPELMHGPVAAPESCLWYVSGGRSGQSNRAGGHRRGSRGDGGRTASPDSEEKPAPASGGIAPR
jgi:hypothetical protein